MVSRGTVGVNKATYSFIKFLMLFCDIFVIF